MTDTLIIGGGLAGSAAALWLADQGRTSVLVEARSRLGGRAHSRVWGNSGEPVEYGGGWIRDDHDQMIALSRRLGVALTPRAQVVDHHYFRDGTSHANPAEDMAAYNAALAIFLADAAQMNRDTTDASLFHSMTLAEYLDHRAFPASLRREVLAWWSISGSGSPDQVGANEYLTAKLAKGLIIKLQELAFTLHGGVGSLAHKAAQASCADIVLGDAVERLHDHGTHICATLVSGRMMQASTALVAMPVNALHQIRFSPALNDPQNRLRRDGHAGRALKVLIRAKGPEPGQLATGEAGGLRWIYADRRCADGTTLLIAFGLFDQTGASDLLLVSNALKAAFPQAELVDFDWHDWCADPFARGTWVSPVLASLPDYAPDHWAPRGRIAFAGADLYSAEQAWFEGALLTAQAAVAALDHILSQKDPQP